MMSLFYNPVAVFVTLIVGLGVVWAIIKFIAYRTYIDEGEMVLGILFTILALSVLWVISLAISGSLPQ